MNVFIQAMHIVFWTSKGRHNLNSQQTMNINIAGDSFFEYARKQFLQFFMLQFTSILAISS